MSLPVVFFYFSLKFNQIYKNLQKQKVFSPLFIFWFLQCVLISYRNWILIFFAKRNANWSYLLCLDFGSFILCSNGLKWAIFQTVWPDCHSFLISVPLIMSFFYFGYICVNKIYVHTYERRSLDQYNTKMQETSKLQAAIYFFNKFHY